MEINTIDFLRGSFSSVFFIAVFFFHLFASCVFHYYYYIRKVQVLASIQKSCSYVTALCFFFANPLIQYCRSLVSNLYLCWSRFVTARSVLFQRRSKGKSVFLQLAHLVFIIDVTLLIYRSSFEKKNLLIGDTGLAIVGYYCLCVLGRVMRSTSATGSFFFSTGECMCYGCLQWSRSIHTLCFFFSFNFWILMIDIVSEIAI